MLHDRPVISPVHLSASAGTKSRLTDRAVTRATALASADTDEARARVLDVPLRTYYRLRSGKHDCLLSLARRVGRRLDMATDDAFEAVA